MKKNYDDNLIRTLKSPLQVQEYLIRNDISLKVEEKKELLKSIRKERKIFKEHNDISDILELDNCDTSFLLDVDKEDILKEIKKLDSKYLMIIIMVFFNNFSFKKCAEILGVNEKTIRRRYKEMILLLKENVVLKEIWRTDYES